MKADVDLDWVWIVFQWLSNSTSHLAPAL